MILLQIDPTSITAILLYLALWVFFVVVAIRLKKRQTQKTPYVSGAQQEFCGFCGKRIPEAVTHCPFCHQPIQRLIYTRKPTRGNTGKHPIGYIGIAFGVVLIISSLFAGGYYTSTRIGAGLFTYTHVDYPYRDYAFPLAIMAILSFIIGVAFLVRKTNR